MLMIGGELAQSRVGLSASVSSMFQGVLLMMLLIVDSFIHYRLAWRAQAGKDLAQHA
jgi:simple sugar transport system permease protein